MPIKREGDEITIGVHISYGFDEPDDYANLNVDERESRAKLADSQCIIDDTRYFLRGIVEVPIIGQEEPFLWGVWAVVHKKDFDEFDNNWGKPGKEKTDGPYFARINNRIPGYPSTLNLKVRIQVQRVGQRPLFEVTETEHLLAKEQVEGITIARVHELAAIINK